MLQFYLLNYKFSLFSRLVAQNLEMASGGNQIAFDEPPIQKIKVPPKNRHDLEAYCNYIFRGNDHQDITYKMSPSTKPYSHLPQFKIIVWSKGINDTNSALHVLKEGLQSSSTFLVCFVVCKNSIYCITKGGYAYKCVGRDVKDTTFPNRALLCIGNEQSTNSYRVRDDIFNHLKYLKVRTREGAKLINSKKRLALTVKKKLELQNILQLIEYLDKNMVSEEEAAVFKKPTIRQINFPPGNAQDPQDYCKRIINPQNATNSLPYTISPSFHISRCDVIVYYKPIDSTIDAVRALTDNLTSQRAYLICFIITENNSIYCITKGLKAFKSVEKHEEKDFASRALHCIATKEVQMLCSRESFGMYTTKQLRFRKPRIPSMVDISGVVTKVHTKVDKSKNFDRNPIPNNVKRAQVEATHSALTICKDLTLKEIVDLIECLDSHMDSDGYYIFEQVSEVTNKDMICNLKLEQSRLNREKE